MKLLEFFGKSKKPNTYATRNDKEIEDSTFNFIIDHDKLHKDYFIPLAQKIKQQQKTKSLNKEETIRAFMPMVKKGCKEYYQKNKMTGYLGKIFTEEIREDLCERLYDHYREDILKNKYKLAETRINEGGNVFAGKTTAIKIENIDPTLDAYFAELKSIFPNKAQIFNEQHFVALGSVRKKAESGDIDLGISATDLLDKEMSDESIAKWGVDPAAVAKEFEALSKRAKWGVDPAAVAKEIEALSKRARTSTPEQLRMKAEQLRMKAFLKMLTLYINANSSSLYCDEKKVTDGNIFGLFPQVTPDGSHVGSGVQIDWMVGDLNWLKFSYHSAAYPKGSNVKGLHRTQLMLAAFQVAGLSFGHVTGVKDKETGKVIASNPDDALTVLGQRLGFKISQADAEDYYKLHKLFKARMQPADYNAMINIYFKILDSTRADIPDDLQDEWRSRKDSLGLTGKFLPDNSALKVLQ